MNKTALIVPSAGSGSRMQTETPKPFLEVAGKPILEHTLLSFLQMDGLKSVIIPASAEYMEWVEQFLDRVVPPDVNAEVVEGGERRQHSIHNALEKVGDVHLVIVHDAVRPFVKLSQIQECCRAAAEVGGAVLGIPVRDTIKKVDREKRVRETPSRKELWQAQTPQVFRKHILVEAYKKARKDEYSATDDASLVEWLGYEIKMVRGDHRNFKITYPVDLRVAEQIWKKQRQ